MFLSVHLVIYYQGCRKLLRCGVAIGDDLRGRAMADRNFFFSDIFQ